MSKEVGWEVDEILILKEDYDLSQLPDSPRCKNLLKLSIQVSGLTEIPPTFFEHMPLLEELDLSTTNIQSLPSSISSLTSLQKLFLRDCSVLMELPSEIRMLTKLKLLDCEGSEIMYIPKEIGELNDLEVLRVSLSLYADYFLKTKRVNDSVKIPRNILSKLNKLKELCITTCPEVEWWEEEVKEIQDDLCHLEYLETLKWYLPTKMVLDQFLQIKREGKRIYENLSNFTLTIGRHPQLTSCLPANLQKKFENFEKCLKWINAEGNEKDISMIMERAEALFLSRHWTIVRLFDFDLPKLKYCLLAECNEMETLVEVDESSEDVENIGTVGLESIEYLTVHDMEKFQSIWKGPMGKDSLSRLRILALHTCPKLTTIFTINIAQNLSRLTELTVEDCPNVTSLISNESPNIATGPLIPCLEKIFLLDLPELESIFSGKIILEKVDSLLVYNCLKLQYLSVTELPNIQKIKGEKEWWNDLKCDKSRWQNVFEQLKEERHLIEQLAEATNSLQHFHDILSRDAKDEKPLDRSSLGVSETKGHTSNFPIGEQEGLSLSQPDAKDEKPLDRSSLGVSETKGQSSNFSIGEQEGLSLSQPAAKDEKLLDGSALGVSEIKSDKSNFPLEEQEGVSLSRPGAGVIKQAVNAVVGKVVDLSFGVVKKNIGYMWNSTKKVEMFRNEVEKLKDMKDRVQQQIDIAKRKGDNLVFGVEMWVDEADQEISKAEVFLEQQTTGMFARHHYGKMATKMTPSLLQLQDGGKTYESGVSVYTRAPGPLDVYQNKDLDGIYTHISALDDIIAAVENDNIQIIGIYGLGGVGKTTLAKEVVAKVKHLFADVAFTTVSETVNAEKIKKDLESATKRIGKGEKVLIILDNVWEKLNLEELCNLRGSNYKNCKILLTSRSQDVCNKMNAQTKIYVNSLPIKEAWILLKHVVGEKVETDADLKLVAKKVAEECGGLPLLIQAVANALKHESIEIWKLALTQLRKHASSEIDPDIRKTFTHLKLSYDYLESEEVKSCFLLCSLFPKDSDIPLEDLVRYGVGLGKFDDLDSIEDARGRVQNAVNILTSSCLLLNTQREGYTKMHDVVRDVALLIASQGNNNILVEAGKGLTAWLPRDTSLESYTGISLMNNDITKLPDYQVHLLSLDIFLVNNNQELSMISDTFIEGMKEVKVLDMGWCLDAHLPQSLKLLTKLRMLNLQGNNSFHDIYMLGEMKELEILILNRTGIKEIPQEIGGLVNLRRLEVSGCAHMTRVTSDVISKLWRLEELCIDFREVREGVYACIVEVMKLSKLTYLDLMVKSFEDIPEGFNSEKLKGFVIEIGGRVGRGPDLRSTSNSEGYLCIENDYLAIPLLKWMKKLIEVRRPHIFLNGIENLNNIMPTLYDEGFNKLEHIQLRKCHNVSCIVDDGDEGKTSEKYFMELKHLELYQLNKLEIMWKCPEEYISLTNLVTLKIWDCHKLERVFTVSVAQGLVHLKELFIGYCNGLEEVIWSGGGEEVDSGRGIGESEEIVEQQQPQHSSSSANTNIIIVFPSLASIDLWYLKSLKSFFNSTAGNGNCSIIIKLPSLVDVKISECESMKNLEFLNDGYVPLLDGASPIYFAVEKV